MISALVLFQYAPKNNAVLLSKDYKTCAFRWNKDVTYIDPHNKIVLMQACEALVENYASLIEALSKVSNVSVKVFWNNFGNFLEYSMSQLSAHPKSNDNVIQALQDLLQTSSFAGDKPNPICKPIRYITDPVQNTTIRIRKICCLNYLLPNAVLCDNCPRQKTIK